MKILIVEDEKVMYNTMRHLLEDEGYEVTIATDGLAALGAINSKKVDLIITDIMMPNLSGTELSNTYKGRLFQDTPVIVISAMDSYDVQYFANTIGASAYLVKPFSGKELLEKVKESLEVTNKT
ncbi:MAG: response regulator transcription factor [Flavobacteriales bacterium]|nr:response regulator transcription factor [Flavobacteriales bacterium]